jgi:hypothetical protein
MLVMMVMHALLILAMQKPINASTLVLNVLITIFAPLTSAKMEFAITLKRKTVTIAMHVLLILATQLLDANTPLLFALITMLAPLKLATKLKDAFTLQKFVTITILALMTLVTRPKDASLLQNIFVTTTNVPENNVTFSLELLATFQLIAMTTMHVPMTTVTQQLVALTLL